MASILKKVALLALITGSASVSAAASGKTTRYWDCCKASCAWNGKASVSHPVNTCDKNDSILASFDTSSGCQGGGAFTCTNQSPWALNDNLALGFAAVKLAGGSESSWCCACYKLTFTSGPVAGQQMIVQATNTGGDLGENHFDLSMPGGGVGLFNGCTAQFGAPTNGWGAQYGGISSRSECDGFPEKLKPGCYWRFDWFKGAENPDVTFEPVACPKQLTDRTGCIRNGETPVDFVVGGSSNTLTTSKTSAIGTSTTSKTSQVTSSTATTTPNPSGTAKKFEQCGGGDWKGPTVCEAGSTCTVQSQWYSQCL